MISKDIDGNEYEVTAGDLTWRPAAYGIVIHDGKILLTKENGKFHLPGGGVELGEDPEDAVVREIREETGILVADPKLVDMNSSFFTWQESEQPPNFTHVQSLMLYYHCNYVGGTLGDVELDEYETLAGLTAEWIEVAKLPEIAVGTTVDWRLIVSHLRSV